MGRDHDTLRAMLGRVGVWTFAFDARPAAQVALDVRAIEALGFPALWVPEGGGSRDVLSHLGWLAANTERLTVASGIANVTAREPDVLEAGAVLLSDAYPDRVVIGIGVGHRYSSERRGVEYSRPLTRTRAYLDAMDAPTGSWPADSPQPRRMLAALGDGMLRLAAERTLGAHTYFVPPAHTAHAREILGPEPVLAVEQTVVMGTGTAAKEVATSWAGGYLELPNYANNWRRLGFEDDVEGPGDRLVEAGIVCGGVQDVARRVSEHLDAGADHVCVQVIATDESDACIPALRELAPALLG